MRDEDPPVKTPGFALGSYRFRHGLTLAPMAGNTNQAYRRLCRRFGAELTTTEMVSSRALHYNDSKSLGYLERGEDERPIAAQIFGSEPAVLADAAQKIEARGFHVVDLNVGCPVPKITGCGGGSALLLEPTLAAECVQAMVEAVDIPVTIKIRAGWDDKSINCIEVAKLIEDCGGSMVTLHGRTRVQGSKGFADWDLVREIKENVSIPVSGSGDIMKPEHAMQRFDETGCDAVHIGRGAIANPYIFRQTWETMNGLEPYRPTPKEMHDLLLEFRDYLRDYMPEKGVIGRMKMLSSQFLRGVPHGAHLRTAVLRCHTVEEMEPLFEEYFALAEKHGIDHELQSSRDESAELAECGI